MGWIVDRIVSVDATAVTLAQQASIQMLEARRAERNYSLLRDAADVAANRASLAALTDSLSRIRDMEPEEQASTQAALDALQVYQQQFAAAVAAMGQPGDAPHERIEAVLRNYEKDLNGLVQKDSHNSRTKLVDELRTQADSFDAQITNTVAAGDPAFRRYANEMENSSHEVLDAISGLQTRNWQRMQNEHRNAQRLLHRAEWVGGVASVVVVLLSIWITFVLPREIVKPLVSLKDAVDHAASGNYHIEFELEGKGEVVELAKSVSNLISHITQVRQTEAGTVSVSSRWR